LPDGTKISAGHDITARKRAEAALHERDERVRLLVEQIPAILWTTDRDLCFTSSAGEGLKALGLEPNQVVGMSLFEYFQTDDPDFMPIAMHRRVIEGEPVTYQTSWDGHVFESHAEPLRNDQGAIIGCLGIALDITERKEAEEKLLHSEQQLRALASRLQRVREEESAIIAREIHDELGQTLTGLKMDISWIRRRVAEMTKSDLCLQVADRLKTMSSEVDNTIRVVRRISTQLRPVILDDLGLMRALEWQTREFESRTGIYCDFKAETAESDLKNEHSTAVFRIFQEILTNVARHAGARNVEINLRNENESLVLDVKDDGRGITEEEIKSPRALGILGMQERAQVCGGNLFIQRASGGGTSVTVKVPLA
jgi:PAS domain S-box-containing protein